LLQGLSLNSQELRLFLLAALHINNEKETEMWKIAVGFVIFAAISLYMIMQFGDQVDMGGEKHGADAIHAPEEKK
jgi:hypothetical protein